MHRGKPKKRVFDVVAGEDGHRPLGRQVALQERRRDGADLVNASA